MRLIHPTSQLIGQKKRPDCCGSMQYALVGAEVPAAKYFGCQCGHHGPATVSAPDMPVSSDSTRQGRAASRIVMASSIGSCSGASGMHRLYKQTMRVLHEFSSHMWAKDV